MKVQQDHASLSLANNKMVRQANVHGGPCTVLGPLARETKTQYVYRRRHGSDATISKRLAHLEPCQSCPDHSRSRFPHLAASVLALALALTTAPAAAQTPAGWNGRGPFLAFGRVMPTYIAPFRAPLRSPPRLPSYLDGPVPYDAPPLRYAYGPPVYAPSPRVSPFPAPVFPVEPEAWASITPPRVRAPVGTKRPTGFPLRKVHSI
jgi:hypothetical protein